MALLIAQAGLFTAPVLAGVGAAAVTIPIIIHLMSRIRRRPEPWGAMRFLLEAYRKQKKKLQLEQWLLLLTRCLLVLFAGLALSGPLLTGCSDGSLSFGPRGRVVYIVIDDALSTQTTVGGDQTRLDGLKKQALAVVDQLEPGDKAAIVRMGRPAQFVVEQPTDDKAALTDAIQEIEPRFSRGELIDGLMLVQGSMNTVGVRDGDAVVVLLSDFPRSAEYLEAAVPPELETLSERAKIVTALPAQSTDNVQVVSVTPDRRMIVADQGGAGAIGVEVQLRRFGGQQQPMTLPLQVRLLDSAGAVLSEATRKARWGGGNPEAKVSLDMPAPLNNDLLAGGRELIVEARLLAENEEAGVDGLPADDEGRAVVRLRRQLQVAMVDSEQRVNEQPGALQPWQWVPAALTPFGPGAGGPFELTALLPTAINGSTLEAIDAVVVLRPDEMTTRGWDALAGFARDGGLVWVFSPAVLTEAAWATKMVSAFDLPWQVDEQLSVFEPDDDAQVSDLPGVDQTTPPPPLLQYLAADWREKLGWIDVAIRVPLSVPAEDRWIVMQQEQVDDTDRQAVMASRQIGRGGLVFTATALDTRFTNLPARALFVPLMRDTLRGVLGANGGLVPVTAGDRPALDNSWRGAGELTSIDRTSDATAEPLMVESDGSSIMLRDPAQQPGVFTGRAGGAPRLLAVNPDASAGDTFTAQPQLEQFLDQLGTWSFWSQREQEGGVLDRGKTREDLTWVLLWVVLGLLLLETLLARRFSHATDTSKPTVVGRVLGALHGEATAVKPAAGSASTGGGA
ncbi:MAG: BatA domain-containing protein [Planctomycetota bacterium]